MIRLLLVLLLSAASWAQPQFSIANQEGDWIAHDFAFQSGEKMAELRLHYTTLGAPTRNAAGHVNNAVLIMHGTGGNGRGFLSAGFAENSSAKINRWISPATTSSCPTPSAMESRASRAMACT